MKQLLLMSCISLAMVSLVNAAPIEDKGTTHKPSYCKFFYCSEKKPAKLTSATNKEKPKTVQNENLSIPSVGELQSPLIESSASVDVVTEVSDNNDIYQLEPLAETSVATASESTYRIAPTELKYGSQPVANSGFQYAGLNNAPIVNGTPNQIEQIAEPAGSQGGYEALQMLRQEVMALRGIAEELSYEVKQLKQRQTDDYLDLDRRIAASTAAPATLTPALPAVASVTSLPELNQLAVKNEVEQYSAAYNLLKEGNVAEAKTALQQHTQDFPEGDYTPNAYYWLGEIYLLENQAEKAAQSFEIVVSRYPAHRKTSDARFKLGTAYHLSGQHNKAQQMLNQAASGVGSSANLAAKYLKENY